MEVLVDNITSTGFDNALSSKHVHIDEIRGNLVVMTHSVMRAINNNVDIPIRNNDNDVEFYNEDEINEKIYDDEPPTNKASLHDDEHIMPSPMFKQLNLHVINGITSKYLISHTGLWNKLNELFKRLRFESREALQYAIKRYSICRNQHLLFLNQSHIYE